MASVNEQVVREYFEHLGFLVMQPNKHQVVARQKRSAEEIDLLIIRPGTNAVTEPPAKIIWGSGEIANVQRGIVSIRGWHTDRFSPAVFKKNPDIFRFTELSVIREARKILGAGPITKILCLSDLSATAAPQEETLAMMRENGIDGILSFRTMMLELIAGVDTAKNYEKSDLLQTLRILKTYNLLKDPQMELFSGGKRVRRSSPRNGKK